MPVSLDQPFAPPVPPVVNPVYDKVHLDQLIVTLERTVYAKTLIRARLALYYTDPESGEKVFHPEVQHVIIQDAEQWALDLYMTTGDQSGILAGDNIKHIVALLVTTQTPLGGATVA